MHGAERILYLAETMILPYHLWLKLIVTMIMILVAFVSTRRACACMVSSNDLRSSLVTVIQIKNTRVGRVVVIL